MGTSISNIKKHSDFNLHMINFIFESANGKNLSGVNFSTVNVPRGQFLSKETNSSILSVYNL